MVVESGQRASARCVPLGFAQIKDRPWGFHRAARVSKEPSIFFPKAAHQSTTMGENDGPTRPVPQLWTQYSSTMIAIEMPTTASGMRAREASGRGMIASSGSNGKTTSMVRRRGKRLQKHIWHSQQKSDLLSVILNNTSSIY